jgi:hypothetical protein
MISAMDRYQSSSVTMLDITEPAIPKQLTSFAMPGQSTQLILAAGGILGPGQVSFSHAQVHRNLQKLTLFSKEGGQELDNLLLGTEYDAFSQSWLDANDDQRIRLGAGGQRLFLPYSGRHHAEQFEPTAHRLNITRIENGKLVSERSFNVSDDIIRTAPLDDAHSLVFANSGVYLVDHTSGDWVISTLRELFVPFATYRLADDELHARIARVGSKCRVTTHAGHAQIFDDGQLAEIAVACGEHSLPIGFGSNLLFADTRTGVRISPDGRVLEPLSAAEVEALQKQIPKGYCYLAEGSAKTRGSLVPYLDDVPSQIICEGGSGN